MVRLPDIGSPIAVLSTFDQLEHLLIDLQIIIKRSDGVSDANQPDLGKIFRVSGLVSL